MLFCMLMVHHVQFAETHDFRSCLDCIMLLELILLVRLLCETPAEDGIIIVKLKLIITTERIYCSETISVGTLFVIRLRSQKPKQSSFVTEYRFGILHIYHLLSEN